jgi:hypothetical protein
MVGKHRNKYKAVEEKGEVIVSSMSRQPVTKPCITFSAASAAPNDNRVRRYCPPAQQGPAGDIKIGDATLKDVMGILNAAKKPDGFAVTMRDASETLRTAWRNMQIPTNTFHLANSLLDYQTIIAPGSGAPNNARFAPAAFVGLATACADNLGQFAEAVFPDKPTIAGYQQSPNIGLMRDGDPNNLSDSDVRERNYLDQRLVKGGRTRLYEAALQYGSTRITP